MKQHFFAGTGQLFKVYLKHDRVITLLLVFLPFLLAYGVAASNLAVLNTPAALDSYIAQNRGNILLGEIAAHNMAAASIWRVRMSAAILLAVLNVVIVISSTRKDEELGRTELLRAGAVGRLAPLAAVLLKVMAANVLGGILLSAGFMAASFSAAGSLIAGLSIALCVCLIAVFAALFAQIAPGARLARGLAFGMIAVFVVINMIGNLTKSSILALLSPFGWCAYASPYAGENWGILLFAVPAIAIFAAAALVLMARRDLNGSYLKESGGRKNARRGFNNPFALALRLQGGMLFVWLLIYAVMGIVIGSLIPTIGEMLDGAAFLPELSAQVGGSGRAFLAILSYILTQVVTAFSIMVIMRCREEEVLARAEIVLSTAVSRTLYISGHICIAFLGSAAAILLFGAFTGDLLASAARIPAVWVVTAIAVFLYGVAPRAAVPAGWGIFGALLMIEFMWELRIIGGGIFALSPFSWVYPGRAPSIAVSGAMLLISAVFVTAGLVGFSRRDITA